MPYTEAELTAMRGVFRKTRRLSFYQARPLASVFRLASPKQDLHAQRSAAGAGQSYTVKTYAIHVSKFNITAK